MSKNQNHHLDDAPRRPANQNNQISEDPRADKEEENG
jgi:hypothetical protein